MNEACRSRFCWAVCTFALVIGLSAPMGCRKDDKSFEVITLEGKVEKIVVKPDGTGEISVAYFSEKHGQEMIGIGLITKDTEIMINGAIATLSEIRQGEQLRGEVRVEKKGDQKRQIAIKIYVDRAQPVTAGGQ